MESNDCYNNYSVIKTSLTESNEKLENEIDAAIRKCK